jgi:hypothetical protein
LDYLEQCYPHISQEVLGAGLTVTVVGWQLADFDNNSYTVDLPRQSTLALASTGQPVEVQADFAFNTVRWLLPLRKVKQRLTGIEADWQTGVFEEAAQPLG